MPESFSPSVEDILTPPKHPALPEQATATSQEKEPTLEESISEFESKLGLHTEMDRIAEAALFIDMNFLVADVVTGNNQHPERFFGDEAWADWIEARLAAKEYGRRPLSPEFITQLHYIIAKRSAPLKAGYLRKDSVIGRDYTNPGASMTVTSEQLAAIKANPRLQFINHVVAENGEIKGKIKYPSVRWNDKRTRRLMLDELTEVCDWYNQERIKPDFDPYKTAALLQHRLISIHAFRDNNGRLSRLLMDWSLENDGLEPALLSDPSDDLFNTENEWVKTVQFSSQFRGKPLRDKKEALESIGQEDVAFILGVDSQQTFYNSVYKRLEGAITPSQNDANVHQSYEQFWGKFGEEWRAFKAEATASGTLQSTGSEHIHYAPLDSPSLVTQGDLVSESYIKLVKSGTPLPESLRDSFFGKLKLFRGGVSSRLLTDADVCRMFTSYIGPGTGYKALGESHASPLSPRSINPEVIANSIATYNQALADDYIALRNYTKALQSSAIPNSVDEYQSHLTKLINIHTGNDSNRDESPFASTSIRETIGDIWGTSFSLANDPGSGEVKHIHGIKFTSRMPHYGAVQSFSQEYPYTAPTLPLLADKTQFYFQFPEEKEVLIPGGIDPNSIESISIFDNQAINGSEHVPLLTASREVIDGQLQVTIKNYLESKARKYVYDPKLQKFGLIEELDINREDDGIFLNHGKLSFYKPIPPAPDLFSEPLSKPLTNNQYSAYHFAGGNASTYFEASSPAPGTSIQEMVAHLENGSADLAEITSLIIDGAALEVAQNLEHINPELHPAIADKLISYNRSHTLVTFLDRFSNLNLTEIAWRLIDKYEGELVAKNLQMFGQVDHSYIARLLIADDQMSEFIANIENFHNLDSVVARELIDHGRVKIVKTHIEQFSNLDESIMERLSALDDGENQPGKNISIDTAMTDLASGKATMAEIKKLMNSGFSQAVIDNIDHIDATQHPAIADMLIAHAGLGIAQHLGNFKNIDYAKIAQQLIENNDGWMVAQNLKTVSSLDHNTIAQLLIDKGQILDLAVNLYNFSNLDKLVAQQLINNGYEDAVKANLNHFSNLDASITEQLAK